MTQLEKQICIFDVNGTLVDTKILDRVFFEIFDADVRPLWFTRVLHETLVLNSVGAYAQFSEIAENILDMIAAEKKKKIADEYRQEFKKLLSEMPPFPDVFIGLRALKEAGYKVCAYSNSSVAEQATVLKNADLLQFIDEVLSTDTPKAFKPALSSYEYLATHFGVQSRDLWMVAAHAWDTSGAKHAGMKTALIKRPEAGVTKFDASPEVSGATLEEVAKLIIDHASLLLRTRDVVLAGAKAAREAIAPKPKLSEE